MADWENNSGGMLMNITAAGNVGIGTASPTNNLQVEQNYNGLTSSALINKTSGTGAFTQFSSDAGTTANWLYAFSQGFTTSGRYIAGSTLLEAQGAGGLGLSALGGPLVIYPNSGVEAMRVTSAGYVGIGTTSPAANLQIGSFSPAISSGVLIQYPSALSLVLKPSLLAAVGTSSTGAYVSAVGLAVHNNATATAGLRSGAVTFSDQSTDDNYADVLGAIDAVDTGVGSNASWRAGALAFHTAAAGGFGIQERMRIDSSGNLGIGTTTPVATLDVNGYAHLAKNSSQPIACDAPHDGSLALASTRRPCECVNSAWIDVVYGTACSW